MSQAQQQRPNPAVPTRYREAEDRSRRLGRTLRLVAGVDALDEELMQSLGEGFLRCDEPGRDLARAMRAPRGSGEHVSMQDLRRALAEGVEAVDDPAPALVDFFAAVTPEPSWLDWDLLDRGARVYHRFGRNAADVLLQLSLIGGYRFGGPTDLLVATGGLTGDMTRRRLGETQKWATTLSVPGALRRHGEAWRSTLHVRVMHALVNDTFVARGWDVDRWGLPINQTDQGSTLGLFDGVALIGVRALGVPVSRRDSAAVMHLWRYVGWLMGVDEAHLVETERQRHRLNYHMLRAQAGLTDAGGQLSRSIVDLHPDLFPGRLRGWYERERLLSMLTVFLGAQSMRELGLPLRPPWAAALVIAANQLRYRVLGRLPGGQARLDRWGDRVREEVLTRYFGEDSPEVGKLPT